MDVGQPAMHWLCALAWVLERLYKKIRPEIAAAIRGVMEAENVVVNRPAIEAGLAVLDAGGDFADGVTAFDGQWLGGDAFVSFDETAVKLLKGQGIAAPLLK